jgi:hypothetical protein
VPFHFASRVSQSIVESILTGDTSESSDDSRVSTMLRMVEGRKSVIDIAAPLRPFMASIAPLLRGENVVLALPFAFRVR